MASSSPLLAILLVCLFLCFGKANAFGAGNIASIAKIEGVQWRHGDIEDTLLSIMMASSAGGKKFDSMMVKRVYFGNWLRDYSQAIDVGALKYVQAGTVRLLLWMLGFMTFGLATGEFEVTAERLGCYRPEEHIDNPKDYADNNDAREYDKRLRCPVDEETELGIDQETGLKNYIANEGIRELRNGEPMFTSAGLVRKLFSKSIELARRNQQRGNKADLYEALRLLGTGLHCLEDFSAHSNYCELALIEMGERDVFPHVGANAKVEVQGREVWPCITGTFGGTDFLHSVMGELSDKSIQTEVEQLENSFQQSEDSASKDNEVSIIKDLMSQLNIGGGDDYDSKASELQEKSNKQKESGEAWGLDDPEGLAREIMPFLEFHDNLMKSINEALEAIGIDALMEKLSEAVSVFVFSLIAPFILPVIKQIRTELATGSSEIIESSKAQQHIVFSDDNATDPTHSMLSKDHFTNMLNEPAGKVASTVLKFVVPKIMEAWDDESVDVDRMLDEIIGSVFHHPAFRDGSDGRPGSEGRERMFQVVENWWNEKDNSEKDSLRKALSKRGVEEGRNHKPGSDSGHGCGKPLHRTKAKNSGGEFASTGQDLGKSVGNALEGALGGNGKGDSGLGGFGSMLGGLAGAALGSSLSGGLTKDKSESEDYSRGYEKHSETSSRRRGGDEEESHSSRRKENRRGDEEESHSSSRRQESSYSSRQESSYEYSSRGEERSGGYSYEQSSERSSGYPGGDTESRRERYEEPSAGRYEERQYQRRGSQEEERSYGGGGRREVEDRSRHHGSGRQDEDRMPGGFGEEQESRHGGMGRHQDESERSSSYRDENRSYGGGREQSSSYGRGEEFSGYERERRGSGGEDSDEERSKKQHHKKHHKRHDSGDDAYEYSGQEDE